MDLQDAIEETNWRNVPRKVQIRDDALTMHDEGGIINQPQADQTFPTTHALHVNVSTGNPGMGK
jgi:hypothetical protein